MSGRGEPPEFTVSMLDADTPSGLEVREQGVRIAPRYGGEDKNAALSWLNWATLETKAEEDAIEVSVSVGDPRGCFNFVVRRLADGRLVLHMPYPGESMPHVETRQLHAGTLVCVGLDFGAEESDEG